VLYDDIAKNPENPTKGAVNINSDHTNKRN
jgi:hypothetical protein